MAWTAPMTFTTGNALTAAQLNTHLRDNLNQSMPAKARNVGAYFVTLDTNEIGERQLVEARESATESTASTTYTDLATPGPSVTVETGPLAFIFIRARMENNTAAAQSNMSWELSGATTRTAQEATAITADGLLLANSRLGAGGWDLMTGLNPGENTFTAKYRAGGVGTAIFAFRQIAVMPL